MKIEKNKWYIVNEKANKTRYRVFVSHVFNSGCFWGRFQIFCPVKKKYDELCGNETQGLFGLVFGGAQITPCRKGSKLPQTKHLQLSEDDKEYIKNFPQ